MQYFNIQVASQLSGVASATIRAWEKRYNAVLPERADNKHRLYSEKDIEKLTLLSRLTEVGQSIGKIAHLDLAELKEVYSTLLHKPYDEKDLSGSHQETLNVQEVLNNFLIALSSYKLDILSHEFEKVKDAMTPRDLCLEVIVPLFSEVGKKVERKELSIAQEHAISAIARFHLGQVMAKNYQKKSTKKEVVIVSTPDGELHEIGILSASLLIANAGLKFYYLGPNLPADALAEAANALEATMILLGVSPALETVNEQKLSKYVQTLSDSLIKKCKISVGGPVKMQTRTDLEKKKVSFFSTLHAFDEYVQTLS